MNNPAVLVGKLPAIRLGFILYRITSCLVRYSSTSYYERRTVGRVRFALPCATGARRLVAPGYSGSSTGSAGSRRQLIRNLSYNLTRAACPKTGAWPTKKKRCSPPLHWDSPLHQRYNRTTANAWPQHKRTPGPLQLIKKKKKKKRKSHGSWPDSPIVSEGGSQNLGGRVGSGQEVFEISRDGSGRVESGDF